MLAALGFLRLTQEIPLAILPGLLVGGILVGCQCPDRQATEQAWAARDTKRASECAQRGDGGPLEDAFEEVALERRIAACR